MKFFIADHVKEGRGHVNFSEWQKLNDKQRDRKRKHIGEEVEDGGMPLASYRFLHPEARLVESQKRMIENWSQQQPDTTGQLESN